MIVLTVIVGSPCAEAAADYSQDVKPIFERRCFACHGPLKQEGNLRLDTGRAIRAGGDSGPSVVPGSADASLLIQRICATEEGERMPPEGALLSREEIRILAKWVDAGAVSPADELPQQDPRAHWAFQKPVRPSIAARISTAPEYAIDQLIERELQARGLVPVPAAGKATVLRRVYLDLIGIPPTRDELQRFLVDPAPDAYERVVDDLLQRPAYGERWGRHWMDVWRYSDWYGRRAVPDVMNSYPQIWRWRDWIVNSLNADKGYDRMVQEMLAADELCPGDDANVVATGFLVRNWFKWNYENWMKDNVEHTAKAFLGLTLNCAHCHDHKYDPLTQEDYFRFRAIFEPLELRQDRVPGLPDPGPFKKYVYAEAYGPITAGLIRVFDEKLDAQTFLYEKGDARNRVAGTPPIAPGIPEVFDDGCFRVEPGELPPHAYYPGMRDELRADDKLKLAAEIEAAEREVAVSTERLSDQQGRRAAIRLAAETATLRIGVPAIQLLLVADEPVYTAERELEIHRQRLIALQAQRSSLHARIAADDARYGGLSDAPARAQDAFRAESRAVYEDALLRKLKAEIQLAGSSVLAADSDKAAHRANLEQELADARAAVDAASAALSAHGESYAPLSPVYPSRSTGRRLALARWIASPLNPLTARVAVNHIWLRHFGRGLVDTPSNFGRSGHRPSHPELLDWLALELMEHGWRMKPIHRLIVTSAAYRRCSSSGGSAPANMSIDPDNVYYWRANLPRMEAEVVRDSLLACASELDTTLGGQEIDAAHGLTSRRRSLYFAIHGEGKMQFLDTFDAPDVCDCYQRPTSVRPQQALALANSDLTLDLSRILAEKLLQAAAGVAPAEAATDTFISAAFETILSRSPTAAERRAAADFLTEQHNTLQSASSEELSATLTGGGKRPSPDLAQRARETMVHALFNHNDFVTVR